MISIASYPKRLIEVDLPIKKISDHARREKSINYGHIKTLHIWFARRPLAACRAVLCAALWPDPVDPLCPDSFREEAKNQMRKFWNPTGTTPRNVENFLDLRKALLEFIADFSNWDNSTDERYINTSRALTHSAHKAFGHEHGSLPLVVDPFAGGGSIPVEALRVGADAYASDLNPVAVLLNKVVLEYIPKYGQTLADEVRIWGQKIKKDAEKELKEFYPKEKEGIFPIAYLWARTIRCEGPGCGVEFPLMRSLWLAKKKNHSVAIRLIPNKQKKRIDLEIIENAKPTDIQKGTIKKSSATCPCCGYTTPVESVQKQMKSRRGGADDSRLICVVTTRRDRTGRSYRLPNVEDQKIINKAQERLDKIIEEWNGNLSLIPDEKYPDETGSTAISSSVLNGIQIWGDLFTPRQKLCLVVLSGLVRDIKKQFPKELDDDLQNAIKTCLALAIDKSADRNSSLCRWITKNENIGYTFGRQALPMMWDFVEPQIFNSGGGWEGIIEDIAQMIECQSQITHSGQAAMNSSLSYPLPDNSANVIFTDPPYYDAIAYGDLSDFFYVWLKRTIADIHPVLFKGDLIDKKDELVQLSKRFKGPYGHKTKEYFENGMRISMTESNRILNSNGIGIVVFAHKSTSGWESQLQAMIDANWIITGSWPIDTERPGRMNANKTAALVSSIHLICRPREKNKSSNSKSEIGEWGDILAELPVRIHEWMPQLKQENVVGADAIFSCLGPALEIFSRYPRVEKVSGEQVTLSEYLVKVWEAVENEALKMIFEGADSSGFEEDARLTAMWLWALKSGSNGISQNDQETETDEDEIEIESEDEEIEKSKNPVKRYALKHDDARKISQGIGAHPEAMPTLIEIKKGNARLLSVEERAPYLFGKQELSPQRKPKKRDSQLTLFPSEAAVEEQISNGTLGELTSIGKTTLDRVHQSMLLFGKGQSGGLKQFLIEDGVGRDLQFWKLAQALTALYPTGSDEKRWVEGVLARKKGLGL
jgi:adenine-specific DNA methylase